MQAREYHNISDVRAGLPLADRLRRAMPGVEVREVDGGLEVGSRGMIFSRPEARVGVAEGADRIVFTPPGDPVAALGPDPRTNGRTAPNRDARRAERARERAAARRADRGAVSDPAPFPAPTHHIGRAEARRHRRGGR